MPESKAINLLPQEEFETSVLGRILRWAMGTFRIIVVITEVIVMGAFLSRFWLDAQNSDLTDSIKIRSAQIQAQSSVETQFRSIQTKLNIASQLSQGTLPSQRLNLITSKLPAGVTLNGLSISPSSSQIKGSSGSEIQIAQFVANLDAEPTFKDVQLGQINSSENNQQIVFLINLTY